MAKLTRAQAEAIIAKRRARGTMPLEAYCFPKQLAFIQDPARFKTACCSRRAGKSIGCAAHLLWTATTYAGCACLYFTLNRVQAKRIIWGPLKALNERFQLGAVVNESDLTLRFPNGSIIYVGGAKDKSEVSKYLGFPLKLVYADEAQSFRSHLEELVDESLGPTLIDHAGTMVLMGTPGPVPVGYFYEMTKSDKWSHHHWTLYDNEPLRAQLAALPQPTSPEEMVAAECKRRGLSLDSPSIQRHFFGQWANDSSNLVFRWDPEENDYAVAPADLSYVVGIDLGYNDADAVAVLGYNDHGVWLVEERVKRKQGITDLASTIADVDRRYKPQAMVVDAGGLGKKIVEELSGRYALPVKAAEKAEKYAHIELLNDAMRTGMFKAKRGSLFVQDSQLLEWDKDKSSGDKLVVSDSFHSDVCDAVLYAFREAGHWTALAPLLGPVLEEESEIEQAALRRHRALTEPVDPWAVGPSWESQ